MTRLLIVRHAANDFQADGILAGRLPNVHLNQEGRTQAMALAQRLASVEVEAIYASPLERTTETAEIVAQPHGLPVVVREGLGEVDFGRWTGESLKRLKRRRLWRAVQFTPSTVHFPGGESPREMQARAVTEVEKLRVKHSQQTVIAVSHADVIKAVVAFYIGLPLDLFQRIVVDPASLTVLVLNEMGAHLSLLNDTGHLSLAIEGNNHD